MDSGYGGTIACVRMEKESWILSVHAQAVAIIYVRREGFSCFRL